MNFCSKDVKNNIISQRIVEKYRDEGDESDD